MSNKKWLFKESCAKCKQKSYYETNDFEFDNDVCHKCGSENITLVRSDIRFAQKNATALKPSFTLSESTNFSDDEQDIYL